MAIEDLRVIGNVLYEKRSDGLLYPVRQVAGQTPAQSEPQAPQGLLSGIPELGRMVDKFGLLNRTFNPVESIGQSMGASQRMFAPDTSAMDRVTALGEMLSGVAGVTAPIGAAVRAGTPAAVALMEGLLGSSPTVTAARDTARAAGRGFVDRMNQRGPVPTMGSNFANLLGDVGRPTIKPATTGPIDISPNSLIFRESQQNRVDEVKEMFPQGEGYYPVVSIFDNGDRTILDGHNRAAVAMERGDAIPTVDITKSEYDALVAAGFDDMEISYAALSRARQDEAASAINQQFSGADVWKRGTEAEGILDNLSASQVKPQQGLLSMGDTLPAPRNEAEAIAKNILELRATGNVDAVTESMMNAADPQYMYNYTPLPMDYASRMRRAIQQGFDVNDEMYRGDAPRQAFETGSGQRDQIGVTASSVPDVAASYIPARGEGGIYPLFSRGQNDAVIEAGGQNWNVILPNTPVRFQGEQSRLDEYIPVNQYFEPYDVAAGTAFFDTNDLSRIFQGYGADRVRFNELVDRGGSAKYYGPQSSVPSDVTMVANPANVRSRFARFDPMFSNLSNLSAGVAISPLAYGLLSNQYERKKRQ